MRQTFCVKFYCRKGNVRKDGTATVEISVIVNGERQMWQLPKKCSPDEFPTKDIKLYCTAIENRINEIYTNLTINNEPISAFIIKDIFQNGNARKSYTIKQMFDDGLLLKAKENCDVSTYKKYERVCEMFYEFTGKSENSEANSVNYADIMAYKVGIEKKHAPQTVVKDLQQLKYFFNLAFKAGRIRQNPYLNYRIKKPQEEQVFLTYDEIKKIRDLKITNDKMDRVRDIFLFMCFTGLEYGDVANLKEGDVEKQGRQRYIKKRRIKTGGRENGEEYISVLYEDAVDIWEAYEGNLPLISNQKLNMYLKQLAKDAGIDKNITTLTARHTYATYLLSVKMLPEAVVQKMLGHTNSTQTRHYAKMLDNSVLEANLATEQPTVKKVSKVSEYRETEDDVEAFNKLLGIE